MKISTAPRARQPAGFTLIEVLVALVIVAISFIAMFAGIRQVVESAIVMQDRTLASWVAFDQLTELRLSGEFPEAGTRSNGEVDMADITWRYSVEYREGGAGAIIRQVIVTVANAEEPDLVLAEATGVIMNQGASGVAQPGNWNDSGVLLIAAPPPIATQQQPAPVNNASQDNDDIGEDGNPFE
jgi:general secretion pathway protein I